MLQIKSKYPCYRINVPDWFRDDRFISWLKKYDLLPMFFAPECDRLNIYLFYDGGEGEVDTMPDFFLEQLVEVLGNEAGIVWLTNLDDER